jgi:hypothetical protein
LTPAKCLKCDAPILKGDTLAVVEGKKTYPSFEPDGKTPHVCKPKEDKKGGRPYFPPKPRERFLFDEYVDVLGSDGKPTGRRRVYAMQVEGMVDELDPVKTFADMEMKVWKYLLAKTGNPTSIKAEEGLASSEGRDKK